jgi:tryptophan-rich sensory protein
MSGVKPVLALLLFLLITFAAAGVGGYVTAPSVGPGSWYASLPKPPWTPPAQVFGPVWTVLYTLMAVAAWLVWQKQGFGLPLLLFAVQLVLNVLWSVLFFGRHQVAAALLDILLLWLAIAATTASFWRVQPLVGALLLPYLLWVSYAITLNWGIWQRMG